jgi:L-lactate dehydrogenase
MVEALTGGLSGHGRADPPEGWGATVFLQIIDPRAFAGQSAFNTQMDEVSRQCHASRPAQPDRWVRTPGERGLKLKADSAAQGVALYPNIMPMLLPWAEKLKIAAPHPM